MRKAKHYRRNTPTEHLCPHCGGTGEIEIPHHNPQLVTARLCSCDHGWVRWAPVDPLDELKDVRRVAIARRGMDWPRAQRRYGELRQRAVSPVNLPRDRKPEPTRAELFADLATEIHRASRLHASLLPVMAQAERVLGARA